MQPKRLLVLLVAAVVAAPAKAAPVTSPKAFFGFNLGDDYCLANYKQFTAYFKKLESESDRFRTVKIGLTEEGREQLMGIVTAPANHEKIAHYQAIARKLALAEGISPAEARKLALEGKAVVWIDGGLHASETLCAQALMETVYQLLSADDAETRRFLDDVIVLFVHANPDGMDLVADWYMKEADPRKRTLTGLPRLYQKYIGHDNNRDFYANTQAETQNMNRVMYRQWFPQIMYNHHQAGPPGTVMFIPPFRDPYNYRIDPLVMNGIDAVGAAIMQRFLVEGKPGATCRSGMSYSCWFNGGLRTTAYFHNIIGLLSETIGTPTPMQIPFRSDLQLPRGDYLAPIAPQTWHFRQSVDYSVTANKAVIDYASRHREQLLYNIWLLGHQAIEHGNSDHWTVTPKMVAAAPPPPKGKGKGGGKGMGAKGGGAGGMQQFEKLFRDPKLRDPRGYILPSNQPDFLTATKFVNALLGTGVRVHRAKTDFEVAGKKYPAGSYVVPCAQAFRAHVLDMFEPQDHPNDFKYPGAPPTKPYDSAGYTLAFQMGVQFDPILDGFDGPFAELPEHVAPPPGRVADAEGAVGFFLSARTNDAFRAVNQLLRSGEQVRRLKEPFTVQGAVHPAGMFFIPQRDSTLPRLEKIAADIGVRFVGTPAAPGKEAAALRPVRVGLWDRYGGSMPSGWTRWLLERFEFPFEVVTTPTLKKGNIRANFDVLILVTGAQVTDAAAELRQFAEAGGTILAIGTSTSLRSNFKLPIENHLSIKGEPLPPEKYYVPPSLLRVRLNPADPLAWGMPQEADVMFTNSPTFRLSPAATESDVRRVAWFDTKTPLHSGWAWGQEHLEGGVAIASAPVGQGRIVLFGPEILFRAQPHGTFKLLFNGICQAGMQ
jgi:hypothetical protein